MTESASNIFSFCLGGLALISAITSTVLYYRAFLPNAQMKILDDLLRETQGIYDKAEAEDLLPGALFRRQIRQQLLCFERSSDNLREDAYQATTPMDEYIGLMKGLSAKIVRVAHDVKKLRSLLITTSQLEKLRREQQLALSEGGADWSPDITLSETNLANTSDAGVRACLPTTVEAANHVLPLLVSSSSALDSIDCHTDVLTVDQGLDSSDYQRLLTHARRLGINGANLSVEQLVALSRLLDRRTSPCCVCSVMNWWRGGTGRPSNNALRDLEDQPPAIPGPDTLSRSSTNIDDAAPRQTWSILTRWRLGPAEGRQTGKPSPCRPWYFLGFRTQEAGDQAISTGPLPS